MKPQDDLSWRYVDAEAARITCCSACLTEWNAKTHKHARKAYLAGFDAGFEKAVEMLRNEPDLLMDSGFSPSNWADWLKERKP